MNEHLMNAILAMDAYNRGYNQGISGLGGENTQIGNYTIVKNSRFSVGSPELAASFFAVAYQYQGNTIISYRGTDNKPIDSDTGWGVGFGSASGEQANMAAQFYNSVIANADPYTANVSFTGHSMGGGLAGLMASLYGKDAVLFDNMAYQTAANVAHDTSQLIRNLTYDPFAQGNVLAEYGDLNARFYQNQVTHQNIEIHDVSFSQITAYEVSGQSLDIIPFQSDGIKIGQSYLDASNIGDQDKHSISLLVLLMYADTLNSLGDKTWQKLAGPLVDALFDDSVANAAHVTNGDGSNSTSEALRDKIAYSVIDEGVMPFGNMAAHVLFDDANDLGKLGGDIPLIFGMTDFSSRDLRELTQAIVQYAGGRAEKGAVASTGSHLLHGIAEAGTGAVAISIDNQSTNWVSAIGANEIIVGVDDFKTHVKDFLHDATLNASTDLLATIKANVEGATVVIVGEAGAAIQDAQTAFIKFESDQVKDLEQTSPLILGSFGQDTIQGTNNNDLIYGGSGDDHLRGGKGDDILIGGTHSGETDTADYSTAANGISFIIGDTKAEDLLSEIIVKDDGDGGKDTLVGIEKIIFSDKADR